MLCCLATSCSYPLSVQRSRQVYIHGNCPILISRSNALACWTNLLFRAIRHGIILAGLVHVVVDQNYNQTLQQWQSLESEIDPGKRGERGHFGKPNLTEGFLHTPIHLLPSCQCTQPALSMQSLLCWYTDMQLQFKKRLILK